MRKYLLSYMAYVEDYISGKKKAEDIELIKTEHLRQIQFMQHERFIHLVVTCLFAIMLFICIAAFLISDGGIMFIVLIILLLLPIPPYVWHYYFMENSTQKMYAQYNKLCEMQKEANPMSKLPDECKNIKG